MHPSLMEEVKAKHDQMDSEVSSWMHAHAVSGGTIFCGRGCSNCCSLAVETTYGEALRAAEALSREQLRILDEWVQRLKVNAAGAGDPKEYLRQYRQTMGGCPLVEKDGACGLYEVRPLACRALHSTRNSAWCGIDLGGLHPLEQKAFLSSLDPSVVAWPTHYAAVPQQTGRALESAISLRMAQLHGFSLSGNFPFLLWLIRKRDLAGAVSEGGQAVRALLGREGGNVFLARVGI